MSERTPRTEPRDPCRDAAVGVVRTLRDAGHVAYLAGGCVRDRLLGRTPKDYDVATDARPERVRKLFPRSQSVGAAFGVVLVHARPEPVEVATFRKESGYSDHRRPDKVEFTTAEVDARRRDFTINALFEDPLVDPPAVIDFVDGGADLQAGVVRAVGDASARFADDYLRMLRAVRFAARLGFTLDDTTADAIRAVAPHLGRIARERIGGEVRTMLDAPGLGAASAAPMLQGLTLDGPALNEPCVDRPLPVLGRLPEDDAWTTRLAAWLLDRHAAEPTFDARCATAAEARPIARRWRKALCLSNEEADALADTLSLAARAAGWPGMRPAHRMRLLAEPRWAQAAALFSAMAEPGETPDVVTRVAAESPGLIAAGVAPTPLVTGDDLIATGRRPGPAFARLLHAAYDEQLEGRLATREDAIAWLNRTHPPT